MKISREQVVARVREEGFHYKDRGKSVEIYRQEGTRQRLDISRRLQFEIAYVKVVLSQAGLTHGQIEDFLESAVKE